MIWQFQICVNKVDPKDNRTIQRHLQKALVQSLNNGHSIRQLIGPKFRTGVGLILRDYKLTLMHKN